MASRSRQKAEEAIQKVGHLFTFKDDANHGFEPCSWKLSPTKKPSFWNLILPTWTRWQRPLRNSKAKKPSYICYSTLGQHHFYTSLSALCLTSVGKILGWSHVGVSCFLQSNKSQPVGAITCFSVPSKTYSLSSDGYDLQFGTNVLGHAHLTLCLIPELAAGAKSSPDGKSRVMNVSSLASYRASRSGIIWDTLQDTAARKSTGTSYLYAQSKLVRPCFHSILLVYVPTTSPREMCSFPMNSREGAQTKESSLLPSTQVRNLFSVPITD